MASAVLTQEQWETLSAAETLLYDGLQGIFPWTDVNDRSDSQLVAAMWEHAEMYAEQEHTETDAIRDETAARVALALATLAFGADFTDAE